MKKRLLSLLLALVMTVSLFSGLSMNALADDVIADWINDAEAIGQVVNTLFNEENIVYHGYCGDMSGDKPGSNVQFDIYEVTNPNELNDTYLKPLFGDAGFDPDQQYYGVWIYGNGDMNNYDHSQSRAPWSGTLTLKTGETVDMEERLIVAYIEGSGAEHPTTTGVTTVGKDAFWGQDNLTAVFLGNTIQKIEARAFESCDMLKAINMPNSLTKILDRAFYACDRLTFLRAKATKITEIGERAFFSCTFLADVELPYTIKTIGPYAFAWCRVLGTKNLILPNGLTTIGEGAFAFCTHFSKLTVPNSVTTIGPYAFLGAYELDELTFTPGTQTLDIGAGAFVANYDLTEVALNRVQSVGISAFGACEKLQRVVFDSTISRINERAFTSMMSDAYTGLAIIAEIRAIGDPSGDLDAFLQGTAKVTPLDHAAFSGDPPSYILAATEATRSFPDDCIVHYPEGNRKWLSQVTDSGTWKGYQTDYYWTGHFHEFEETTTKEASCEEAGNIHRACTVYGCGYEDDVPVAALGHDYKAYKTFDPTCTEPGGTFEQCSRCGDLKQTATTDPLGHDERTCTVVPATCETPGSVTGNCVRCGEPINRVLPATGHTIPSATVLQEPTCTTPGLERGMCADCGKIAEKEIPATGHTPVEQPAVAATCTTPGKTAGSVCSVCGEVKQQETVPALGHNYVVTERVEPTTTTAGHVTYTCSRCHDTYTDPLPATACTGGPACPGYRFTDMPKPDDWAHEGLDYCVENGIINGTSPTTISPKGTTTRGQLVTMLYRMTDVGVDYSLYYVPFTDVKPGAYYYAAVAWAADQGIVDGVGDGRFDPNSPITREQLATILMRYTNVCGGGATGSTSLSKFPDAQKVSSWAYDAMRWAVANGLITGSKDNGTDYLKPQGNADRDQVAAILMRYQRNIAK